jgi:hypothetical protein
MSTSSKELSVAKVYKVVSVDQKGNETAMFVTEENKRRAAAMMSSEYGNVEVLEADESEVPEDFGTPAE